MKEKHLHCVQSIEPLQGGGLGSAAMQLSRQMTDMGLQSRLIATAAVAKDSADGSITEFRRIGPDKAYYSSVLHRQAASLVAAADVVHLHGFYVGTSWLMGRQSLVQGKSLVCHPHGFFEPWILNRSKAKKRIAHYLFEDANFKAAKLWRALTNKEADQIRALGITAPIVVAPNGIHIGDFDRIDPLDKDHPKKVLFLGRLHPKKGLPMLINAWSRVGRLTEGWELVIAGPDELNHRRDLELQIEQAGLAASVRFTGTVTGQQKIQLIKSAALFVLPSYSEGFSVALLEAMACRIPLLITSACNFPEIEQRGAGWVCEPTFESVTSGLQSALRSQADELRQRGEIGRKLLEENYSWESIARSISVACEQVC